MSDATAVVEAPVPQAPPSQAAAPGAGDDGGPDHDVRAVLRHTAFRRLWAVLAASSFGDWLGLLATTAFAATLAGLGEGEIAQANLAVAGVFLLRLAPALLLGPLAGVVADRFDRRTVLVLGDVLRGLLFVSIPLVGSLWWLYVATVLVEIVALFWMPAKDALVPTLVPRRRLEAANQLSVVGTYGTAPLAALAFAVVDLSMRGLGGAGLDVPFSSVDAALVLNGVTFLVAGAVIWRLPVPPRAPRAEAGSRAVWREVVEGWRYIARHRFLRGLVGGMIGAFAAAGTVLGLGLTYVDSLGAGRPGYGVLFGAVFVGMALGVWQAPRWLAGMPRRRLFGSAIAVAGVFLVAVGLSPSIVVSTIAAVGLGAAAGAAWVTGQTLLGGEVDDAVRGRTFAFVQTAVRVVLVAVLAAAPALAALVERGGGGPGGLSSSGAVLAAGGLVAVGVGVAARLSMAARDGDGGVTTAAAAGALAPAPTSPATLAPDVLAPRGGGFFVAVEGGDGAGKTMQVQRLVQWLGDDVGHDVVVTREPGGTQLGKSIRALLLGGGEAEPVPRAEALLFAADRAQHVATTVRPALDRGAVVVTDRYVDSSLAYQGARPDLDVSDVATLSAWATEDLRPDLTILLDVDPEVAARRLADRRALTGLTDDRIEAESTDYHRAVREVFLGLAAAEPDRYLVLAADRAPDEVAADVRRTMRRVLPLSPRQQAVMASRLAADAEARAAREPVAVAEARTWLAALDGRL